MNGRMRATFAGRIFLALAAFFHQDLTTLFDLLRQEKIKPLIAQRFPLAEARRAQELLGSGGVTGKLVLVCNGASQ